jgi:capsular exopolysaccharide synthesis family protein
VSQYDINLREYWRILKKRKLIVLLVALALGVFSGFFAHWRAPKPVYTSECTVKFDRQNAYALFTQSQYWSDGTEIETQLSVIGSYPVLKKVAQKLGKVRQTEALSDEDFLLQPQSASLLHDLQSKIEVEREEWANIIKISATDSSPTAAQQLANAVAFSYKEYHAEEQRKRADEAISFITRQLAQGRERLKESEEEFNRFSREKQLVSIDLQSETLLTRAKEVKDQLRDLDEANSELQVLKERLKKFTANPSSADGAFYTLHGTRQYEKANDKLVELLLKRDSLLKDYTRQHPEVIAATREVIETARKMILLLDMQIRTIGHKREDLKQELAQVEMKTNQLMEKKLEYDRLKRKVDSYTEMVALLESKNQEAQIRKAEIPDEVSIVRPALLPIAPTNPPKVFATGMLGVLIGVILGMLVAFITETFDTSLSAIEDVESTLETPVLGIIPHGDGKTLRSSVKETDERLLALAEKLQLAAHFAPRTMLAESFRALRTNVVSLNGRRNLKSIMITSASPQEGKTLVATNLAIAMAQAGRKTLLVESDLRKPVISHALGIDKTPGLTDVILESGVSWREAIRNVGEVVNGTGKSAGKGVGDLANLNLLTSGAVPSNPAEVTDSPKLLGTINEMKANYEMIIFDSPPILSTADPAILGSKVDGVLLVYRVGSVSRSLLKRSVIQLNQVQANVIGVALNDMKAELSPDFADFKYYKYYYSDKEKKA